MGAAHCELEIKLRKIIGGLLINDKITGLTYRASQKIN